LSRLLRCLNSLSDLKKRWCDVLFITFVQELNDEVKEKVKFPTKQPGRIKNLDRGEFYGEYLSDGC